MNKQTLALVIQEGSRLVTTLLQNKDLLAKSTPIEETPLLNETEETPQITSEGVLDTKTEEERISGGTACIPCCIDHYSTCAGLLSDEAVRMARRDGIDSPEVISRILSCRSQLNAMEREDLSAEKIAELPDWEKEIAILAQNGGAAIRHELSDIRSIDDLESVAIQITDNYKQIGGRWLKREMANMSEEEKDEFREKAAELLDKK